MSMWRRIGRLLAVAALAAPIVGCTTEQVSGKNWSGPKTRSDQIATPKAALDAGVSGLVMLRCIAGARQVATDCDVVLETPTGWGFGQAALSMQPGLRAIDTASVGGGPLPEVGERFFIPLIFCPEKTGPKCGAKLTREAIVLGNRMDPIEDLAKVGRCAEAIEAANGVSAEFARSIAGRCKTPSLFPNP